MHITYVFVGRTLFFSVVAFAFTANAQFFVGGNLGLHRDANGAVYDGKTWGEKDVNFDFTFAPKVGYQFNDVFQVGAKFLWNHEEALGYVALSNTPGNANYDKVNYKENNYINMFGFGIFARCNVYNAGSLTVFCEADLSMLFGTWKNSTTFVDGTGADINVDGNKATAFGVGITPGLNYAFNDHFSMDLYLDLLGISYTKNSVKSALDDKYVVNSREFNLLSAQNGVLSIGFNYKF